MSHRLRLVGIIAVALLGAGPGICVTLDLCVPPQEPIPVGRELAAAYRAEIIADYERFWAEGAGFIACLDESRASAMAAMSRSVSEYNALLFDKANLSSGHPSP